jgi:hypothetical protein
VQKYDPEEERERTKKLIVRFNSVAILFPALIVLMVYLYLVFSDQTFERKEWKTVFFITWLSTMFLLGWEGLRVMWGPRPFERLWKNDTPDREAAPNAKTIHRWENRATSRLIKRMIYPSILVPTLTVTLVWLYGYLTGTVLTSADWKTTIFITWIAVLGLLFRLGKKESGSKSRQIIYTRKE